jgi:hypothetical protein
VPARHPLRKIKSVVEAALLKLDADFAALYAADGRPSIAPERLIRASLVQILFSVRSERQLMEQLQYNLLFRWFVGLSIDEGVWVPTVFTKNRDRLLNTQIAQKLMAAILAHEQVVPLPVGRALLCRRHARRSVGLVQELQAEGRDRGLHATACRSAARCRRHRWDRLNWKTGNGGEDHRRGR